MKEIQDIVKAYDKARLAGKQTALATVVHVQGSSYRRAGARMLVTEDGELTGAISGGCLEGDALRKARLVMAQQKALLVTYDTTDDDDAKLGVGLGCNGIIQILIEPIADTNPVNPIALLKAYLSKRQTGVLVTLFSLHERHAEQPGTCFWLTENTTLSGNYSDADLKYIILSDAAAVLKKGTSETKTYVTENTRLTAFLEYLQPTVSLVIIGAGNDVMPLVKFAYILGWPVIVVDGRANYATATRFPEAARVLVAKPDAVLLQVPTDEQTVFVLMTHNYNYDIALLRQLLPLPLPYVGVLGPKKKLERMLQELPEQGTFPEATQLQKVFGPMGLDIGAETPEEIALSIISEIKAVLAHKTGTSLRDKAEAIHPRETENIAHVVLKALTPAY